MITKSIQGDVADVDAEEVQLKKRGNRQNADARSDADLRKGEYFRRPHNDR